MPTSTVFKHVWVSLSQVLSTVMSDMKHVLDATGAMESISPWDHCDMSRDQLVPVVHTLGELTNQNEDLTIGILGTLW